MVVFISRDNPITMYLLGKLCKNNGKLREFEIISCSFGLSQCCMLFYNYGNQIIGLRYIKLIIICAETGTLFVYVVVRELVSLNNSFLQII